MIHETNLFYPLENRLGESAPSCFSRLREKGMSVTVPIVNSHMQ
jgi:hypothetical protein